MVFAWISIHSKIPAVIFQIMINKINNERRRSMNATPIRPSNKNQWQGAQADPKQKNLPLRQKLSTGNFRPWPSKGPDLNLIYYVWDVRVSRRGSYHSIVGWHHLINTPFNVSCIDSSKMSGYRFGKRRSYVIFTFCYLSVRKCSLILFFFGLIFQLYLFLKSFLDNWHKLIKYQQVNTKSILLYIDIPKSPFYQMTTLSVSITIAKELLICYKAKHSFASVTFFSSCNYSD
jgi:hypothetical protein